MAVMFLLQSCGKSQGVVVEVSNPTDMVRMNEMVEIDYAEVLHRLNLAEDATIVVLNSEDAQVPYQVTFDGKLIFMPAALEAMSSSLYRIVEGTPDTFATYAIGAQYPQRVDDIAWENSSIAFRTYGPALQASGERAYGYDAWVKCVDYPVVADRYAAELDSATIAEIARLKEFAPDSAAALYNSVSYHVDHGNGLDYYKVGPTLGAGTAALIDAQDNIVYPYCYEAFKILDNGPLRFTVGLRYRPFLFDGDTVVETRVIRLDEGSQLNRVRVVYHNLNKPARVVSGIVLHDRDGVMEYDASRGYAAYAEPADSTNGQMYLGMAYDSAVQTAEARYFDDKEREERGAEGHLVMERFYQPGEAFTYYTGAGWNKWGFDTPEDWFVYMRYYANALANPLLVTIK